jgi:hypothetical protein
MGPAGGGEPKRAVTRMQGSKWDDAGEPVIGVTMEDGRIVIRPSGLLDRAGLDALEHLVRGARAAGATAVVDLTGVDPRPGLDAVPARVDVAGSRVGGDLPRARVVPDAAVR